MEITAKRPASRYIKEWVVVDEGPSKNYPLTLTDNALDTNGLNNKPVRYYINEGPTFDSTGSSAQKTDDGNFTWYVRAQDVNTYPPIQIQVRVLDDDGLIQGGTFWVFADSAPPTPTVSHTAPSGDSITIYWKNKDIKDGDSTHYRVLLHQGTEPDPGSAQDIICNWKSGYRVSDDAVYDWMYRFKMPDNDPKKGYYYQVHSRDRRGTVTPSTSGHTFSY